MRFFSMEQDRSLPDRIELRDFDILGQRHLFLKKDADSIQDSTTLYLADNTGETAPDFIQSPIFLVSDTIKKVLDFYEDDMVFKTVAVVDKKKGDIFVYHTLLLEPMDMLSEKTEFYPNGSVKRLVLDAEKIGEHHIFLLDDQRFPVPLVSLEIVESLLRRQVTGIVWKEVEVE